uniref:Putative zinc finger, CCHC-type n=1 Tax=Tanacetum cinerariifolium TaxID=118510 RepID=A0A6L2LEZ7_TANCI|nr:putative zinc finger, CCHC-type [Tanacetum cinerariifolium]
MWMGGAAPKSSNRVSQHSAKQQACSTRIRPNFTEKLKKTNKENEGKDWYNAPIENLGIDELTVLKNATLAVKKLADQGIMEKDNTFNLKEIGSTTHFQCPMLKGANYTTWAIRMQVILEANGLWEMIEPNENTQADNKKDKTAIAFLYQALPEEQLLQITKHKTAKAIWDALKTRHIGEKRVQQARLQTLKSDFEMLHMKEDETIDTFTTKLTTLVNKAASLGHTMEDETLVRKLLNAVPDRYLQIVASIEQYSDLDEMSLDEAIRRLKTYEERIKYKRDKQVNSQESLMFTQHEGQRKPFRVYGHGRFNQSRGREQDKNDYQSKKEERAYFEEDTRDKSQVTCYRCHELGHYAYECPNKRKNQVREHSNFIEKDLEPTLLMATINEKK